MLRAGCVWLRAGSCRPLGHRGSAGERERVPLAFSVHDKDDHNDDSVKASEFLFVFVFSELFFFLILCLGTYSSALLATVGVLIRGAAELGSG